MSIRRLWVLAESTRAAVPSRDPSTARRRSHWRGLAAFCWDGRASGSITMSGSWRNRVSTAPARRASHGRGVATPRLSGYGMGYEWMDPRDPNGPSRPDPSSLTLSE
jgi:hypothetical protein